MMINPTLLVDFPLRGEWRALQTPAERVPSHGTDYFAQRYAYDFAKIDPQTNRYYPQGILKHVFRSIPASDFYCWDAPVDSCFGGRVIGVGDGWPDRQDVNLVREMARASFVPSNIRGTDYRPLTGNYVMIEGDGHVAVYAHLKNGSIGVAMGQEVEPGEVIGSVGNSGNSTMPHLHFQVMRGADPLTAEPVFCGFREYDRHGVEGWERVVGGVPGPMERIRWTGETRVRDR